MRILQKSSGALITKNVWRYIRNCTVSLHLRRQRAPETSKVGCIAATHGLAIPLSAGYHCIYASGTAISCQNVLTLLKAAHVNMCRCQNKGTRVPAVLSQSSKGKEPATGPRVTDLQRRTGRLHGGIKAREIRQRTAHIVMSSVYESVNLQEPAP